MDVGKGAVNVYFLTFAAQPPYKLMASSYLIRQKDVRPYYIMVVSLMFWIFLTFILAFMIPTYPKPG